MINTTLKQLLSHTHKYCFKSVRVRSQKRKIPVAVMEAVINQSVLAVCITTPVPLVFAVTAPVTVVLLLSNCLGLQPPLIHHLQVSDSIFKVAMMHGCDIQ